MKNWKESLLRSGLPLEYEVKQQLLNNKCAVKDEYTYIKPNENNIPKEFSYDLDGSLFTNKDTFNFLIECKYRSPGLRWIFLPQSATFVKNQNIHSFLHSVDFFRETKSQFETPEFTASFPYRLGPFCKKGIEIGDNKCDESSIRKAIYQLSYGMIEKILNSIEMQINFETIFSKSLVFHHIPIIVTTAELYLLNQKITINEIENAIDLDQIATKEDFLIYQHDIGIDLESHNFEILENYFKADTKRKAIPKLKTPNKSLNNLITHLAKEFSPKSIIIINHKQESYDRFFTYLNELVNPSEQTKIKFEENKKEYLKNLSNIMGALKLTSPP